MDDEKGIIDGQKLIIQRSMPECEIIGFAFNGLEGFNLALELNPDIIITDIRMPKEDGLEMTKRLKEAGCTARFIIVSGYSEFEYAKRGMQLGVKFYINKPIEEEELYASIRLAIADINSEREKAQEIYSLKNAFNNSLKSVKDFALRDILDSGSEDASYVKSVFASAGFQLTNEEYICAIFDYNNDLNVVSEEIVENIPNKICMHLTSYSSVYSLKYVGKQLIVIISNERHIEYESLIHSFEEIKNILTQQLMLECSIGIGLIYKDVCGISKSFQEAKYALNYKIIKGMGTIIEYKKVERISESSNMISEGEIIKLQSSIDKMDIDGCDAVIEEMFAKLALDRNLSIFDLQIQCLNILLAGIRKISVVQLQLNATIGKNILSLDGISRFKTIEQLKNWLKNLIKSIIQLKFERKIPMKKDVITEIREYVSENFDKNISLAELSSKFFINPYYLSQMYKEKTGDTYLNSVMKIRINKAKELLEKTNLKIYEICEMVGYTDCTYFSKLFEKHAGCKPSEYKKKLKQAQKLKNDIEKT